MLDLGKPKICVAYTGGTIGGRFYEKRGISVGPGYVDLLTLLKRKRPEILECADLIEPFSIMDKLSENMTSEDWRTIAQRTKEIIDFGVDGIVITHGTDTLEYTASALSFMLKNLPIPVVITGSNYPADIDGYARTDAIDNLYDSIIASSIPIPPSNERLKGVYVVFGGYIHLGTKVKKLVFPPMSWGHFLPETYPESGHILEPERCFISANFGTYLTSSAGSIRGNQVEILPEYQNSEEFKRRQRISGNCNLLDKVDSHDRVYLLKIYPDFNVNLIRNILSLKQEDPSKENHNKEVLILELYNSGTGNVEKDSKYSLASVVREAVASNNPVIIASQQIGTVTLNEYETSRILKDAGAFSAKSMTSTTAYVKAKCIVGRHPEWKNVEEFKRMFLEPEAGEITLE